MAKEAVMKNLNEIDGFRWAAVGGNKEGLGKVSICGESFWLKDCKSEDNGKWTGVVDNYPIWTDDHGLRYGDEVEFIPTKVGSYA